MSTLRQLRCGIRDCTWTHAVTGDLTARFGAECFVLWRQHLIDAHGMNPNLTEDPGLACAQLFFDYVEDVKPSVLTIHAIDRRTANRRAAHAWLN